jgi:hypothetical protein
LAGARGYAPGQLDAWAKLIARWSPLSAAAADAMPPALL